MKIIKQENQISNEYFSEYIGKVLHCNNCDANIKIEESDINYLCVNVSIKTEDKKYLEITEHYFRCCVCGCKIHSKIKLTNSADGINWDTKECEML